MRAWKLFFLGGLLVVGVACDNGRITVGAPFIEAECYVGNESPCGGAGYVCVGALGARAGDPGTCQDMAQCRVGNNSACPAGQRCVAVGEDNRDGAPGVCVDVLRERVECYVGDNTCNESNGYACIGTSSQDNDAAGTCQDVAECRVGDSSCDESNGYACIGASNQNNGSSGTCQDVSACRVGDNICDESNGYVCMGTSSQSIGSAGTCQDVAACRVGDNTCDASNVYACIGTHKQSNGSAGTCQDVAECRVGDNTCDENDGYACMGTSSQNNGSAGSCQDVAECRVGDNSKCAWLEVCVSEYHTGAGAAGACQRETLDGVCSGDEECIQGQVCGPDDICIYGKRNEGGNVVATLSNFQIRSNNQFVVPLRAHGTSEDKPDAGWVGPASVEMRVVARGPDVYTTLIYVETSLGLLDLSACSVGCTSQVHCEWSCILPAGWAGGGPKAEVVVGIAAAEEQVWTYRVSSAPTLHVDAPQTARQGEALTVCLTATTTDAPLDNLSVLNVQVMDGDTPLLLHWTEKVLHKGEKCWTTLLPEVLTLSNATRLRVSAEAVDVAGNVTSTTYNEPLFLIGISCVATFSGAVNAPLTWVNGRLVFAANDTLHFFDADHCIASGSLQTGPVQGPMVALANGSLAVATSGTGGPSGRQAPRLLMVNAAATPPSFSYGTGDRDCVPGQGGSHNSAQFNRGLSLLSLSPVRYAAPANRADNNNSVLLAYTPSEAAAASRCIGPTGVIGNAITIAPVQDSNAQVLISYGSTTENALSAWRLNAQSQWEKDMWMAINVSAGTPLGIALSGHDSIWLSSSTNLAIPALQLWRDWATTPIHALLSIPRFSLVAIDSQDRAYVVGYNTSAGYDLHLLNTDISGGPANAKATLPQGTGNGIVGSPILGQPRSGNEADTEIYVVSGNGRVFAFNRSALGTLRLLWMISLGFEVSNTAQPVLSPNASGGGTLWVVGLQGQVRGIRVNSDGLNRFAPWPKAFRDNCNTGSRLINHTNMSACF